MALTISHITSIHKEKSRPSLTPEIHLAFWPSKKTPFGLQQALNNPQWKNEPWEAVLPQGSLATFLSSYHSNLCPTAWKPHTSTPKRGYQCPPSPRTWPRYIVPGNLTPQTMQYSDTLSSCHQGGSRTQFHMRAEDGDAGNHETQSA